MAPLRVSTGAAQNELLLARTVAGILTPTPVLCTLLAGSNNGHCQPWPTPQPVHMQTDWAAAKVFKNSIV